MKVFDCFTFFNEIDLLKIRLEYLYDHVDYFVISESNQTHSGHPKPLYFEDNKSLFSRWLHKIIHIVDDHYGLNSHEFSRPSAYDPSAAQWTLERSQRDAIWRGLDQATEGDLVIVTDVDEIWNPRLLRLLSTSAAVPSVARLGMSFHYYYVNCVGVGQNNRLWTHPYYFKLGSLPAGRSLSSVRTETKLPTIRGVGWHFSYLGGEEKIREKLEAFAHQEYNTEEYKDLVHLQRSLDLCIDHLKRDGVEWALLPFSRFPDELISLFLKYGPSYLRKTLN